PRPALATRSRKRSASSRSGPALSRPMAATISRRVFSRTASHGDVLRVRRKKQRRTGSARAPGPRAGADPHLLQIVEGADLGAKDMDDHVARVDQHPIAKRRAFDPHLANARLVQFFEHTIRARSAMACD